MERSLIDTYILYRTNPDNDDKADSFFASSFGFSIEDVRKAKRLNKDWAQKALEARRGHYAENIMSVDKAMFQAAKAGDTKAADLLYRRFDGWNPKIVEQTNNFYNFADLVKDIKAPKITKVRRENL
jgi:hypothetical protein